MGRRWGGEVWGHPFHWGGGNLLSVTFTCTVLCLVLGAGCWDTDSWAGVLVVR